MTSVRRTLVLVAAFALAMLGLGFANLADASPDNKEFGIQFFESQLEEEDALAASQAGSHPYAMRTVIVLSHHEATAQQKAGLLEVVPNGGDPKDVEVNLPAGLIANPNATISRCPDTVLEETGNCPSTSQVGVDTYTFGVLGAHPQTTPIYIMETPPGAPAELGFKAVLAGITVHILGRVRTGGDYGISAEAPEINQQVALFANSLEVWGYGHGFAHPFLTLPTSCGATLAATVTVDSWQEPARFAEGVSTTDDGEGHPVTVTGCQKLEFNPRLRVQPTTHAANSPTGLHVELSFPQEESGLGLVEADLREAAVTLPAGMGVSAAAASGALEACTSRQIGLEQATPSICPNASKIGTVTIETPLLETPLEGSVYLAQQGINPFPQEGSNPFKSLIALYLVAEGKGVLVKMPGEVRLNAATGQLTARFGEDRIAEEENPNAKGHLLVPQFPVDRVQLDFFSGPRAALITPANCGTYTVTSSMTPYSAPESGPPATPSSSFEINERCEGSQFRPSFTGGTDDNQAGAFSTLSTTFFRPEEGEPEQNIDRVQVKTPPGLLGMVSSVPLCEEPQAAQGTCGQASLIGHVTAGVGAGTSPLDVTGQVFLTGPYEGAPYGLSIVVPAIAGPFNLGIVKVRAAISVDPLTATLTVTSDPLPQILEGVPLQLRVVNVSIDRKDFIFNPTDCAPLSISSTTTSSFGLSATSSSRFQATNCATLGFTPKFEVTTSGRTSRADGASLATRLTYPKGAQANIARVKIELPKLLPARLKTLQKACAAVVFETNPAECPGESVIGIVRASTPVLPAEMTGPVYFVSHGGEAFPDVVIVLQGDGVRVDLSAATFISKKSVTSATFNTVPDVPVSSFEVYLPEGSYSALSATGDLCKTNLEMPTTFVAQNGAELHQDTPIAVSDCPKRKPKAKSKRKAGKASRAGADVRRQGRGVR